MKLYLKALNAARKYTLDDGIEFAMSDWQILWMLILLSASALGFIAMIATIWTGWEFWWIFWITNPVLLWAALHIEAMVRLREAKIHRYAEECP